MATAHAIARIRPDVKLENVEHLEPWIIRSYNHTIKDPTSLHTAMATNSAYDGIVLCQTWQLKIGESIIELRGQTFLLHIRKSCLILDYWVGVNKAHVPRYPLAL